MRARLPVHMAGHELRTLWNVCCNRTLHCQQAGTVEGVLMRLIRK